MKKSVDRFALVASIWTLCLILSTPLSAQSLTPWTDGNTSVAQVYLPWMNSTCCASAYLDSPTCDLSNTAGPASCGEPCGSCDYGKTFEFRFLVQHGWYPRNVHYTGWHSLDSVTVTITTPAPAPAVNLQAQYDEES